MSDLVKPAGVNASLFAFCSLTRSYSTATQDPTIIALPLTWSYSNAVAATPATPPSPLKRFKKIKIDPGLHFQPA